MPSAVVFDLDETLLDSGALRDARDSKRWNTVAGRLREVRPYEMQGWEMRVAELPGLLRANGYRIGVLTHAPRWYAEHLLEAFDIDFDALITGSDPFPRKPDPTSLRAIAAELGTTPKEVVLVGDSDTDFGAASNAGATSVGVCWSRRVPSPWRRYWPDIAICRPERLPDALRATSRMKPCSEVLASGASVRWHWGSLIRLGDRTYSTGRYFAIADRRHRTQRLSQLILDAKQGEQAAALAADLYVAGAERLLRRGAVFELVTSVPPKPGEDFDRFQPVRERLARACRARSGDGTLSMLYEVEDYKNLDHAARAAVNAGRFKAAALRGERMLLVDDVLTSEAGGQAETCRQKLLAAGAAQVTIMTLAVTQQPASELCPLCGGVLQVKNGIYGRFVGCSNWVYLKCPYKEDLPPIPAT